MNRGAFADISLLLVAIIWGTTFVVVQKAISFLEPYSFNGVRFLIAALILAVWLILFERTQLTSLNLHMLKKGTLVGFFLFLGYAFQTLGLQYTTSSKAGFITGLSVVLVPLFSFIFLKQTPTKNAVIGVLTATVGLFLLTMKDSIALNIGDGYVFLCALSFALHIIFTGKYTNEFPTLLLTVVQLTTVSLLSLIGSFIYDDWSKTIEEATLFRSDVLSALLITSVFATALAFLAQTNFQKYTTPTRVALIFATEPVFAAITGYFWANDRLSTSALYGCLLILIGMVFAELPSRTTKKSITS